MKRKLLNKIVLLTTLVIGFSACKKGKQIDLLERPEPFTAVRVITGREHYDITTNVWENAKSLKKIDLKIMNYMYDIGMGRHTTINTEATNLIYLNNSFESKEKIIQSFKMDNGLESPDIVDEMTTTQFWQEDVVYKIQKIKSGLEPQETHTFNKRNLLVEEMSGYSDVLEGLFPLGQLEMSEIYLTDKGEYRAINETYNYNTEYWGGRYYHIIHKEYFDITINKEHKITRNYIDSVFAEGEFSDSIQRSLDELTITTKFAGRINFEYGNLTEMPGIAQKVSSFPASTFGETRLISTSYETNLINNKIQVNRESIIDTRIYYCDNYYNADGSVNGFSYGTYLLLQKDTAVELKLTYVARKLLDDGSVVDVFNEHPIELLDVAIRESEQNFIKVIKRTHGEEDHYYLIYTPNAYQPDAIRINFEVQFDLTPGLDEGEMPTGTANIKGVEVRKNTLPPL